MKKYFALLDNEQKEFIATEFEIDKEQILKMDEDVLYDIYDGLGDIEIEEIMEADDGSLSERGKMASSIVTVIGNAMAEVEGLYD